MSTMSDQPGTRVTSTEVRGRASDTFPDRIVAARETKPSLATSEMWLMLAGVAALIVTYLVADDESLDLFRTCLLCSLLGAAYFLSRGLAKSGSRDWHSDSRPE